MLTLLDQQKTLITMCRYQITRIHGQKYMNHV